MLSEVGVPSNVGIEHALECRFRVRSVQPCRASPRPLRSSPALNLIALFGADVFLLQLRDKLLLL